MRVMRFAGCTTAVMLASCLRDSPAPATGPGAALSFDARLYVNEALDEIVNGSVSPTPGESDAVVTAARTWLDAQPSCKGQ